MLFLFFQIVFKIFKIEELNIIFYFKTRTYTQKTHWKLIYSFVHLAIININILFYVNFTYEFNFFFFFFAIFFYYFFLTTINVELLIILYV